MSDQYLEGNEGDVSDHVSENEDETELRDDSMAEHNPADANGEVKKKYDPKDPSRPRRKKARRACYACQRAHLTCGDERPCKRCIKRGLADACQDGVRKKAKYLHDAPPEALRPVLGPEFNPNVPLNRSQIPRQNSLQSDTTTAMTPQSAYYSQGSSVSFPSYGGGQGSAPIPEALPFNAQQSPINAPFPGPPGNVQAQMNNMMPGSSMEFNALFDPSNPALYNFDLEGLNFGSQYAGWEFGILNKMTLGAETPPRENSISQTPTAEPAYPSMYGNGPYDKLGSDFAENDSANNYSQGNLQHGLPHAYAIPAGPTSLASPSTDNTASPKATIEASPQQGAYSGVQVPGVGRGKVQPPIKPTQNILAKRQRDSASIYTSVKDPYPYTAGFHNMVATLRNRLPGNKLLAIARALGEIRPSFIACTKDLTREDLIFMEKCFQRTLVEFDDFLQHCCAPTIVCRRSGEVVAVNKEFTALTGWTKDILLGKEPNQNVYVRSSASSDGGDSKPETTPRPRPAALDASGGQPQPVFLTEVFDDDSIVEFYQDFAQLAFEDSRGRVQRSGRLLRYRTQDALDKQSSPQKDARSSILSNRVTKIDAGQGISRIEKDGKVNCTYCWTIKRDTFDIPMMIIINFLPRYQKHQEPHQLAV